MRQLSLVLGLLMSCMTVISCVGQDRSYFMSLNSTKALPSSDICDIYLGNIVEDVLANRDAAENNTSLKFDVLNPRSTNNEWTIRLFQVKFELELDAAIQKLNANCHGDKSSFTKWLATYSLNGTDPDQDLKQFQEYLESVKRVSEVLGKKPPIQAENNDAFENEGKNKSQWCGNPKTAPCKNEPKPLYKVMSEVNPQFDSKHKSLDDLMAVRIKNAIDGPADNEHAKRFFVLGYQLPWSKDKTEIRYGLTFYFEERKAADSVRFIGYRKLYANEATPASIERPTPGRISRDEQFKLMWTPWKKIYYATGYPFAVVIGIKNAVFELAKVPFSGIGSVIGGRDSIWHYPAENVKNAGHALYVETANLPSYGILWGIPMLLSELPLVGQIFQLNTGPEFEDLDLASPGAAQKIFLSRGIYGGGELGQDTGLWAAHAEDFYPKHDIYAPSYMHGTIIDVVWSMFNLSHGPAYAEANYVMGKSGPFDHLYLAGHSGGVQRSTSASRILANHSYSVVKVFGIAGPSVGQAYVDTRYGNPYQIFLNTQSGTNEDIVGKIGLLASSFSTVMEYGIITPLRFTFGFLTSPWANLQRCTFEVFDHMGFSNAVIAYVPSKRSTLHQTPFRMSLNEPIIFDAYIRSEFQMAFREDLMRPNDTSLPKLIGNGRDLTDVLGTAMKTSNQCKLTPKSWFNDNEGVSVIKWYH